LLCAPRAVERITQSIEAEQDAADEANEQHLDLTPGILSDLKGLAD